MTDRSLQNARALALFGAALSVSAAAAAQEEPAAEPHPVAEALGAEVKAAEHAVQAVAEQADQAAHTIVQQVDAAAHGNQQMVGAALKDEHDAHGAHGGHHEIAPLNWADFSHHEQLPYIAGVINFVILLALYIHFGRKPIAEALKKRKHEIAHDIEEAAKLKREAEQRAEKYQADLANLDKDLQVAREGLVDAGKKERERLVSEAEERAARMVRDAETLLVQEGKQKSQDLRVETIEQATDGARSLLASKLTAEDHLRLAEEFLMDLSKRPADKNALGGAA